MDFMTFIHDTPLWFLIVFGIAYAVLWICTITILIRLFIKRK